ncbi:sugar porter family MFS transporter [Providencia vermicola]|uniref:sugar porter family MFS transporter n=1 Tax=Providencia vermicola TaxID=333965 RepID=UPI0032DB9B88
MSDYNKINKVSIQAVIAPNETVLPGISSDIRKANYIIPCFLAALAGLLFGLDVGVISGALQFLSADFLLSTKQQELVVSILMAGATLGAISCGKISSTFGRKKSLLLGASLFVIGSIGCAAAFELSGLLVSRFLLGVAVGIASYTAPIYLSEIAPAKIRGSMISLYQLMITVGILAAFLSNTAFSFSGSWRWMLGIITFPALILFVGVLVLPESPRWLISKGRNNDAKKILLKLRGDPQVAESEYVGIEANTKNKQKGFQFFVKNNNFKRSVFLGISLQIMQQVTGITIIMYYAPKILSLSGFVSTQSQMWGTVAIGLTNVLATIIAIVLVDRWGRKPILYIGYLSMAISLGIIGFLFSTALMTSTEKYLSIFMLLIFIVSFAMSAGPLIWVLCSEIQPMAGRDFGVTCSTAANWIGNFIVGATFLSLIEYINISNTFLFYAVLNLISLIVIFIFVPETKNISLENIEINLMSNKKLRDIGVK